MSWLELILRASKAKHAQRAELLTAAVGCFAENGLEATTIRMVHQKAGMTNGSAYHAFPGGKPELVKAVYQQFSQELLQSIVSARTPKYRDVAKYLCEGLLKPWIAWVSGHQAQTAFMFQVEAIVGEPDLRMAINESRNEMRALIVSGLHRLSGTEQRLTKMPETYVEGLIFGPIRFLLTDALRNAQDFKQLEKRVDMLARAAAASLDSFASA